MLLLSGCSASSDEVIAESRVVFDDLVDSASGVDEGVLHTLEVEKPSSESCGKDTDAEHTVFIAAGTMAVQSTLSDGRNVLKRFDPLFSDDERWTPVRSGLSAVQSAYIDTEGITASAKVEDGLLVIAVFSPCR
jgi:hypothetical protein